MSKKLDDTGQEKLQRLKTLVDSEEAPMFGATDPLKSSKPALKASSAATSVKSSGRNETRNSGTSLLFLGLLFALGIMAAVVWQVGGSLNVLWNPQGLLIVFGGTIAATLLAFKPQQVRMLLKVRSIFFYKHADINAQIAEMMLIIRTHFKDGVRTAEEKLERVSSDFLKLGLQLAIDGTPIDDMVHTLNWRLQKLHERDQADARLFRTMALFAPAFGMFGTVAGVIGMLQELGSRDLNLIGVNMAVALVTTFYGLFLGYLIFRPLALRVEQNSDQRIAQLNVLMQGVLLFRLGRRPASIEDSVKNLLESYESAQGRVRNGGRSD